MSCDVCNQNVLIVLNDCPVDAHCSVTVNK